MKLEPYPFFLKRDKLERRLKYIEYLSTVPRNQFRDPAFLFDPARVKLPKKKSKNKAKRRVDFP